MVKKHFPPKLVVFKNIFCPDKTHFMKKWCIGRTGSKTNAKTVIYFSLQLLKLSNQSSWRLSCQNNCHGQSSTKVSKTIRLFSLILNLSVRFVQDASCNSCVSFTIYARRVNTWLILWSNLIIAIISKGRIVKYCPILGYHWLLTIW